jgi:hypothetical protein
MRWTQPDIDAAEARIAGFESQLPTPSFYPPMPPVKPARSKLKNERIEWQGQKFDSRKELRDFQAFEQQRSLGAIRAVVRQVSMPLPGSRRRIRIDFMVVENSGCLRWFDSKGFDTPVGKLKRDQIEQAYGVRVELI